MWCRTEVIKTLKAGGNLILYVFIFLVQLYSNHIQQFILQKDDMSSEQVIKYRSYIKWPRLRAVLQTLYLLTVPADTVYVYSYPFTAIWMIWFCKFWSTWGLRLPIQRYCNSLFAACDCEVVCFSLHIPCICVVPW